MKKINQLHPQELWGEFQQICQIPHPSKSEKALSQYIYDLGKGLGLETLRDELGNILIRKPATEGRSERQGVVLQAHMDMVPQKSEGSNHDFTKDPIAAYIDGEWVTAEGTTLGADNGIGVAAALAVLKAEGVQHGPLEVLITVDEEAGMTGVNALNPSWLQGKVLLNLDSEDEGEVFVGCAGGVDVNVLFNYEPISAPDGDCFVKLSLRGLKGGHSGIDINSGKANANKLLTHFVKQAIVEHEVRLASFNGGGLRNAIPREAFAVVSLPKEGVEELKQDVDAYLQDKQKEYGTLEPNMEFEIEVMGGVSYQVLPEIIQDDLVNGLVACFNGVYSMSSAMAGVVSTSSSLGIVKTNQSGEVTVNCLVRSDTESKKAELCSSLESVFGLAGAKVSFSGSYPGWKPNANSQILKTMSAVYEKQNGTKPKVTSIHAGLECGIIGNLYPKLDMISFGPTIRFPHSPDEKVHIASVERFWDYLLAVLAEV